MLGSVFNRHQASSSSESWTKLRTYKIGKDSYPFSEFRSLGPPDLKIGVPGDIYIDITPGLHALYARYPESWLLWPGSKDVSTLLLHPTHSNRCLWCTESSINWYGCKGVRINPSAASDVISGTLKHQAVLVEESKKRKRDPLHQPIRTKPLLNTHSPSQNRTSLENQSSLSPLHSTTSPTPYSQPALETIPRDLTPHITQTDSGYLTESLITDSHHQNPMPTERDHTFTNYLNERSERNLQDSPNWIDLRKIALGGGKLRPKSQKRRRTTSFTATSVLYPTNEDQSLPQPTIRSPPDVTSQPSIRGSAFSGTLADWELPTHRGNGLAKESPLTEATQKSHLGNMSRPSLLNISIAKLRRMKDAFDANAMDLQATNDKIYHLEVENAMLRARLLNQCQCNMSSRDIPVANVEMPITADSDTSNDTLNTHGGNIKQVPNIEAHGQPQRELAGPGETVRNIPSDSRLSPGCYPSEEPESSAVPELLTETTSSNQAARPPDVKYRMTDIFKVEADTPLLGECKSSKSSSPSVGEEIVDAELWHAPVSTLLRMRDIHRSVLFAKAGSFLICRICLGTRLGEIETVDQVFKIAEDSPELMQEHCEKEHPDDCEALMNMSDEELLDVVSMISSEC